MFKAVQGTAGNIGIAAGGTITVDNAGAGNAIAAAGTGTVTLDANGAASDLLVNDGILSVNGAITLTADNDVIFQATVTLRARQAQSRSRRMRTMAVLRAVR